MVGCLDVFKKDSDTPPIVMIGEIGRTAGELKIKPFARHFNYGTIPESLRMIISCRH